MKSERGGEEAEQEASSLEFHCYVSLPKHTQELVVKDGGQTPSILQNPRLGWSTTASKAPGVFLVHPRQYWGQEEVVMGPETRNFHTKHRSRGKDTWAPGVLVQEIQDRLPQRPHVSVRTSSVGHVKVGMRALIAGG